MIVMYKSFAVIAPGKNKIICQDASWSEDHKDIVSIAVVADGHGNNNCFRSDKGAKFAVECAKDGIYNFVKDQEKLFKPDFKKMLVSPSCEEFKKTLYEKLIIYTVRSWNKKVGEHFDENPFQKEELEKTGEKYRKRFAAGEDISKAYGTSLIATAITPYYWFGFHIGDGRLTALYPDGSFDQPVPWDPKCYLNITTSICDDDVLTRDDHLGVRSHLSIYDAQKYPPVAVFLCTDGVDDNYPIEGNEKHLYKLYRTIALTFSEDGFDSTCKQLQDLVNQFAIKGKGDDTSIAGVIDMETLMQTVPILKKQIAEEGSTSEKSAKEENSHGIEKL